MNQTKRNWLAALFATLAAVLLAAALCFALPFSNRRASGATVTVSDAAELQERMAAAQEGDTIQLSANITIPSSDLGSKSLGLYASAGHESQTLDLNGHTLSIETGNSDACFIVSGLTFTVVNSVPDQGGLAGKSHGSFVKGYKDANLILRDIEITFENNSGSASTAPVVAGFENRLTLDNVTYQLTNASQPYVANIAGRNYTDLAAAVGAASDGQTVQLVASFEEAVTIPAGKNIKLDLNGNTLTSKESGTATVTNYGRLTIQDTAEEKGGITRGTQSYYTILNEGVMALDGIHVYNENAVSESAQASLIDNNVDCAAEDAAQLSIRGGTYETKGLNVVKNDNYGVLVIENGAFTNKYVGEDNSGGASVILASGASTTISGGTFKQMGANNNYVVRINVAGEYTNSVTISGGEFIGTAEDAPYTYPALYLMNVSGSAGTVSVSISGGVFKGSISERGAVTGEGASAEDALTVTGGLFEGNISLGSTMQVALQGGDYAMIPPNQYLGGETELYQYTSGAAEKEGLYVLASEQPANTEKAGYIKVGSGSSAVTYNSLADALVSTVSNNIYLLNDIAESVIYTGTANKTIRLQGYTWTAAEGSPAIITQEGAGQVSIYGGTDGMVTRTDAGPVIVNHGKFQLASSGTYSIKNEAAGNYALIENDGMLTIANGTLVSDVVLKNSGTVNITSTSKAIFQGAKDIVNDGGNISIANGTFNGTSANIQNIVGTVTLRGGTYSQKLPIGNGVAIAEGYRLEGENAPYTVKLILAQISRGEEIISFTGTDIWKLESEDTIQNGDTVTILEYVSKTLASDGESFNIKIDASEIVDLVLNASFTGTLTNDGTMNISGGTFEDAIVNDGGEIKITGGQFAGGGAHAGQGGAYIRTTYAYLADGYYFTAHNNSSSNLFTVGKGKAVATVSHDGVTMDFGSFEAAAGYAKYAAANASDLQAYTAVTITLLQDTVLSSGVDLGYNSTSRAASWLIDLNGKTVTSSSLSLFTVGTNSKYPTDVTIKDGELVVMSVATEFLKRAINVNYGTLTLEDVNISYGADTTPPDHMIYVSHAVDGETAELTIDGGKHYGTISAVSGASVEIKRGEFSAPVSADYLASGTSLYRTQENTYVAATAQPAGSEPVALAGAGSSLQDLLNAGGTVVLTENITASVTINADVTVTLDLNGNTLTNEAGYHTITNNGTLTIIDSAGGGVVDNISHACSAVRNNVGGTVVFSGGTFTRSREAGIDTENNGGNSCYVLQNFGEMKVESGVTVSMKSGYSSLFENGWYDGRQNATQAEAVLTIEGGTFSGGLNTIKNDDWGVLTIKGGKFTNMQQHAVLNWNMMEINGGTFEVTDDSDAVVCVGFVNDSMDQGKLTITGGTFNGGLCAVYANTGTDIEISDGTFNSRVYALSGATIAITGGTFNHSVYSASCENFISGGTFRYLPQAAYMADNCSMNSDGTVSNTAPVAQFDRDGTLYAFASLDDAIGLAAEGETVTLLADLSIASAIKIEKGITFDLNGHDIFGACSSILIISADDVTVTNSGADESVIELLPTGMQQSSVTVINVFNQESAISVRIENITVRHSGEDNIQQVSGIQAAYLVDVTLDNIRMEIGSPANLVLGVFVYGDEASASIANSDIRVDKAGREARAVHSQWADVTITNTQIETNDSGVVIFGKSDNSAVDEAISADKTTLPTLTLNNSEVNAEIFAVCGNGLSHGTVINIIDSIIVSRSAQAIYHPQYGYLTISGDTSVTGVTGIEMRAGNLIVEDGTITATGAFSQLAYGGGSTLGGVAVGVSQHTTDLPVSVTLEGGTYTATDASGYALYEVDLQNNVGTDKIEIDVRDGIFMSAVFSENAEAFISGGTFTMEFPAAEYVAENCSMTQYGVVTDIAPAAEIEKDGKVYAFATIADALALASRGDTITLVGNVTENVVIAKNKVVTLDLNGYTLTNATGERGDHTILNNGTLTIIDGSYAGTGRVITTGGQNCAAVYNAIGGEVTLDGGTYTSNRTTGDYYIIQNHSAMTINDGVTVLQPSVVSSGIASGWYTLAEESQTTYLTINGGTFASNRITVKNDEINVLVINGGTFDQTEGYGDAGYAVQSVQNWAIGILGGGTFGANVQSWAYQSGAGIVRGSLDITGGAYLGTVSAHYYINSNESQEDDMPDVEISAARLQVSPPKNS